MIDPMGAMPPNEVPVGALPAEVADDIDIKASEGEYIMPANVVRFIGLDKIEKMVNKAKEQLEAMNQNGRIGGEPMLEEAPMQEAPVAAPQQPMGDAGFAEGGLVSNGTGSSGIKLYTSSTGETMYIPFLNGQPLYPIPEGYTTQATEATPTQEAPATTGATMSRDLKSRDQRNGPAGGNAKPMNTWTTDDYVRYGDQLGGMGENLMRALSTLVPGGSQILGYALKQGLSEAPDRLDQMIESGKDAQGNSISPENLVALSSTREKIRDRIAADSGKSANPFERLGDFVKNTLGFGQDTTTSKFEKMTPDQRRDTYGKDDPSSREGYFGQEAGSAAETKSVTENILKTYDSNNQRDSQQRANNGVRGNLKTYSNDDLESISRNSTPTSSVGTGPR